jgi:NAD(P)-dependent dehydrogenase (short-subunit alcohol dehydrogenase family)
MKSRCSFSISIMQTLYLTGSSGALAAAVREHYLSQGWNVAGFDRTDDGFRHNNFRFYQSDAFSESSISENFQKALADLGTPRALVATVGGVKPWTSVSDMSLEDFRFLVDLNLVSFFLAAKHAMRLMKDGGTITSIGAMPALEPSAKKGGYVAAKAGVIALTRVLAEEGKSIEINANSIVPTIIHTKANEEWGDPEEIPKWTEPEDIAALCFYLSSEAGKSINGSVIRIPNRM